jgi:hypothetical protein
MTKMVVVVYDDDDDNDDDDDDDDDDDGDDVSAYVPSFYELFVDPCVCMDVYFGYISSFLYLAYMFVCMHDVCACMYMRGQVFMNCLCIRLVGGWFNASFKRRRRRRRRHKISPQKSPSCNQQ